MVIVQVSACRPGNSQSGHAAGPLQVKNSLGCCMPTKHAPAMACSGSKSGYVAVWGAACHQARTSQGMQQGAGRAAKALQVGRLCVMQLRSQVPVQPDVGLQVVRLCG